MGIIQKLEKGGLKLWNLWIW